MAERLTVPVMKKRLDTLLKVVRYYGSPDGEYNYCATCPQMTEYKISELQCGHFIKRGNHVLKYERNNLMPQCRRCNHFLDGAQDKAAVYILDRYGTDELRRLVYTDNDWLLGRLKEPNREQIVFYYNYWLQENRFMENQWSKKLIPKSWEATE